MALTHAARRVAAASAAAATTRASTRAFADFRPAPGGAPPSSANAAPGSTPPGGARPSPGGSSSTPEGAASNPLVFWGAAGAGVLGLWWLFKKAPPSDTPSFERGPA